MNGSNFLKGALLVLSAAVTVPSLAQTWTALAHPATFSPDVPLLMTDGTLLVHGVGTNSWYKFYPYSTGSYTSGGWSALASTPTTYKPQYFASAVLPDGKVLVVGGKYNGGTLSNTNQSFLYDPVKNTWTSVATPWANIGAAQLAVLSNGTAMLADPTTNNFATFKESTLSFTASSATSKADPFEYETWALMTDGSIFTYDYTTAPRAERFLPTSAQWETAGGYSPTLNDTSDHSGPMVLVPGGTLDIFGADGNLASYAPPAGSYPLGQFTNLGTLPKNANGVQLGVPGGPATLLPSGNVLVVASPVGGAVGSQFYEYNGTTFTAVSNPPSAASSVASSYNLLLLPTGQVLETNPLNDEVEIYTPKGSPLSSYLPTISSSITAVTAGSSYSISGTQFNGLSQGTSFGSSLYSNASNYPLVRITNTQTKYAFYCRTSGHSTMGVNTGATSVSTNFAVPSTIFGGPATLQVVANGIASAPLNVTVTGYHIYSVTPSRITVGAPNTSVIVQGYGFTSSSAVVWNGTAIPTTVKNSTELTTTLTAAQLAKASTNTLTVSNLAGGATCNVYSFLVVNPTPTVSEISPTTIPTDSGPTAMVITGTNFVSTSTVKVGSLTVIPTSVTPTTIDLTIPASALTTAGNFPVYVVNPAPGGGYNPALTLTVSTTVTLTGLSLNPTSVVGGTSSTGTVTLSGPAPSGGLVVALKGSTNKVTIPASVTVPAGATTATFTITTKTTTAKVTATAVATAGGASSSAVLTVTP